jgi:hypothetical protein
MGTHQAHVAVAVVVLGIVSNHVPQTVKPFLMTSSNILFEFDMESVSVDHIQPLEAIA